MHSCTCHPAMLAIEFDFPVQNLRKIRPLPVWFLFSLHLWFLSYGWYSKIFYSYKILTTNFSILCCGLFMLFPQPTLHPLPLPHLLHFHSPLTPLPLTGGTPRKLCFCPATPSAPCPACSLPQIHKLIAHRSIPSPSLRISAHFLCILHILSTPIQKFLTPRSCTIVFDNCSSRDFSLLMIHIPTSLSHLFLSLASEYYTFFHTHLEIHFS